jgi:hypothetical protein
MKGEGVSRYVARWLQPVILFSAIGLTAVGCGSVPGTMPGRWLPAIGESNTNSRAFKKKVEADQSIPDANEVFGL